MKVGTDALEGDPKGENSSRSLKGSLMTKVPMAEEVVLVMGGASGMGLATANRFLTAGARDLFRLRRDSILPGVSQRLCR
jgi:hypothetical protein